MSYIFEKKFTETYEVSRVWLDFMNYKSFSRVRKDKPECEFCDTPFKLEDNLNLAMTKGNKLICDSCAKVAVENGAEPYRVPKKEDAE